MDWNKLDSILDGVERALLALSGTRPIKEPEIERWRWDEAVITLAWMGPEHIKRNIGVRAVSEVEVSIEVNAWQDADRDDGKARIRHWEHAFIGHIKVSDFEPGLARMLEHAFFTVEKLRSTDLKREAFIQTTSGV